MWLHNLNEVTMLRVWNNSISKICIAYLEIQNKFNHEMEKNKKLISKVSKYNSCYTYI
jgi:hypothetical protein